MWFKIRLQPYFRNFPSGVSGEEPACQCRRPDSIPGLGQSPGGGHGNPLQCSCLETLLDRGAWRATVHRITKSWTWLKWLSRHAGSNLYENSNEKALNWWVWRDLRMVIGDTSKETKALIKSQRTTSISTQGRKWEVHFEQRNSRELIKILAATPILPFTVENIKGF